MVDEILLHQGCSPDFPGFVPVLRGILRGIHWGTVTSWVRNLYARAHLAWSERIRAKYGAFTQ